MRGGQENLKEEPSCLVQYVDFLLLVCKFMLCVSCVQEHLEEWGLHHISIQLFMLYMF